MNLANMITLLRIFCVPVFMVFIIPLPNWFVENAYLNVVHNEMLMINKFIVHDSNFIAAILFIIVASTDWVGGYIARKRNQVTKFGKLLDSIADKLIVTAALIALVQRHEVTGWVAMIIIGREFITTGISLIAVGDKIMIKASNIDKTKTLVQLVAIVLCLLNNHPFSQFTAIKVDSIAMLLAVCITIYSGYDYIVKNLKVIDINK